jgi:hypothetical protein
MAKEYITVGVGHSLEGVKLAMQDPDDENEIVTLTVEPEFARRIAEKLTLNSFDCEDARRRHIDNLRNPPM